MPLTPEQMYLEKTKEYAANMQQVINAGKMSTPYQVSQQINILFARLCKTAEHLNTILHDQANLNYRVAKAMQWMTDDMKHRFSADNPDTEGDYSPELKEAIELLRVLKEGR